MSCALGEQTLIFCIQYWEKQLNQSNTMKTDSQIIEFDRKDEI